jgi:hypothetical protein
VAGVEVEVVGMAALGRDVSRLCSKSGYLESALATAALPAVEPVASATRGALPQHSGRLAGSVRTSKTRTGAKAVMGGSGLRYAGWVEFGGHRKAPHESTRPYQSRGRYLFPAAASLASVAVQRYSEGTQKALDGFAWTNEGTSVHD